MSISISELGTLNPVDTLDGDTYKTQTTKSKFAIPSAGRYSFRATDAFTDASFGKTNGGDLKVDIAPEVTGPAFEGFKLRYCEVSAKTFDRDGSKVSLIGDYLKSVGYQGNIPGDPQEIANLVERTAGAPFEALIEWRGYHHPTRFEVKGEKAFPMAADGTRQPWMDHPSETVQNDKGETVPLRVWARPRIVRFFPRTN